MFSYETVKYKKIGKLTVNVKKRPPQILIKILYIELIRLCVKNSISISISISIYCAIYYRNYVLCDTLSKQMMRYQQTAATTPSRTQ